MGIKTQNIIYEDNIEHRTNWNRMKASARGVASVLGIFSYNRLQVI